MSIRTRSNFTNKNILNVTKFYQDSNMYVFIYIGNPPNTEYGLKKRSYTNIYPLPYLHNLSNVNSNQQYPTVYIKSDHI